MKIIYFGSSGHLSSIPLRHLLESGHEVSAIAARLDGQTGKSNARLPVIAAKPDSVEAIALAEEIPLIRLQHPLATNAEALQAFSPELVLVSCFAERLPNELLSIPSLGCFNLHPSLLPAYRGPAPVFWQYRDGLSAFGVTLHRMSDCLDAGNIVAQARVSMPDGVNAGQADRYLAEAGAHLLNELLDRIRLGSLAETPQDEGAASYQSLPGAGDFSVSVDWPARRLFNFIRATGNRGLTYSCEINGVVYPLAAVDEFRPEGNVALSVSGDQITIPCNPGFVRARLLV